MARGDFTPLRRVHNLGRTLNTALQDAPKKDAGFSPLTLAWVLESFAQLPLARVLGWSEEQAHAADIFCQQLIEHLTRSARPE